MSRDEEPASKGVGEEADGDDAGVCQFGLRVYNSDVHGLPDPVHVFGCDWIRSRDAVDDIDEVYP